MSGQAGARLDDATGRSAARAAILVVTHNSRRWFARQRAALEAQTVQAFDLFVWDNGSSPEEQPQPEDFPSGARIVLCPDNLGFAAANNRAASLTSAPLLALLNPDAFPEPDWLATLLAAAAAHPEAAAFGSTQVRAEDPTVFDGLGDAYLAVGVPWRGGYGQRGGAPRDGQTFSVCAAAAMVRRTAWQEAEGFDETLFSYGEDVDLGFRLRLFGWSVRQIAAARVAHVGGASAARRSPFAIYHGRRNRLWVFVKNMPLPLLLAMAPFHAALTLGAWAFSLGRPSFGPTHRALGDGLKGLGAVWRRRRIIQQSRRATTAQIARALCWNPLRALRRAPMLWD